MSILVLWQSQEEKDAAKAKEEETKQEIQRLTDELTVLNQQTFRNKHMREVRVPHAHKAKRGSAHELSIWAFPSGNIRLLID